LAATGFAVAIMLHAFVVVPPGQGYLGSRPTPLLAATLHRRRAGRKTQMIYELRTYTLKAGTLGDVVKAASTVSRDIRGDDYGKLEGYWMTEIGPLNQVMHLWSYSDLNERARLRAEYIPLIRPNLVRQDIRLLNAIKPPLAPASKPNIYELRNYRAKPGAAKPWLDLFTAALEHREKYSKIVALWQTEAGQPNEVCHLWAYGDLNARAAARGAAVKDPGWQTFLGKSAPLLEEMHSTVLLPAPHSPLQ
jgi:NIPSNAP